MAIALSWSRISDWQQCPRKFYLKYIEKAFPQEDMTKSPHLVKGSMLHKQLENYVYGLINKEDVTKMEFHDSVKQTLPLVDKFISAFGQVWPERQVAVTYDFKPTGWFDKDVAFRAIWDLSGMNPGHAAIVDYKSGKVAEYGDECGQLHLSAAMANSVYEAEKVDIFYAFIEFKIIKPSVPLRLTNDDFPHIRNFFLRIYDTVNRETDWAPRANQFCNWCAATKDQCPNSRK